MEFTGKSVGVVQDYSTGKYRITFEVNERAAVISEYDNIKDIEKLKITVKQYRQKRSLDANSYFHVLVGKIAEKLHMSEPECKNYLLGQYGQRETDEDEHRIMISCPSEIDLLKRGDIHLFPVGYEFHGEDEWTQYEVIRGSHTYNTQEMSVLIDGTVSEAQELGIDTTTPDELERMKSLWRK